MNAILQCLSQTEVLTNYFLNEKNINKIMNNNVAKKNPNYLQLSPNYYNLIHILWSSHPNKCFSPKGLGIKGLVGDKLKISAGFILLVVLFKFEFSFPGKKGKLSLL